MIWRLAVLAPLAILLMLFAVSNREVVALKLWPFNLEWDAPLAVAVLAISALAFLLGAGIAWASSLKHRRRARDMEATAKTLRAEIAELKSRVAREVGAALPAA
jgi:uncharacterized integral membrane protein